MPNNIYNFHELSYHFRKKAIRLLAERFNRISDCDYILEMEAENFQYMIDDGEIEICKNKYIFGEMEEEYA